MNISLKTALNGIFSIYKPKGVTSRQAATQVQLYLTKHVWETDRPWKVKRKDRVKLGMGGILDPMAEGVLVLGVGTGCKHLSAYLTGSKEYIATGRFGQITDTYDALGKTVSVTPTQHIDEQLLRSTLDSFSTKTSIPQMPPIYSGLKMHGKRLYEYARNGLELPADMTPRLVRLYQLNLIEFDPSPMEFTVKLETSGGFYVRSFIFDVGQRMNSGAHMTKLIRTKQGQWGLDNSLDMSLLERDDTMETVLRQLVQC